MTGRAPERGSPATVLRCGSKSARTLSNEEEAITEDWTVRLPDQLEALKTRSSLPELDQEDGPVRRQVALEPSENRVRTRMCARWPSAAAAIGEALKLGFPRHSSPEPAVGRPRSRQRLLRQPREKKALPQVLAVFFSLQENGRAHEAGYGKILVRGTNLCRLNSSFSTSAKLAQGRPGAE